MKVVCVPYFPNWSSTIISSLLLSCFEESESIATLLAQWPLIALRISSISSGSNTALGGKAHRTSSFELALGGDMVCFLGVLGL